MDIIQKLAAEFKVKVSQVENTVQLIDEGNTIPFIARYRKEVTGGLTDVVLRDMDERLKYLRNLEERKEEVIRLIEEQGKLTEDLKEEILKAEVLQRVEDLYKPFKQKKATRASKAREKGLEPLAMVIYAQLLTSGTPEDAAAAYINPEKEVNSAEDALQGACDIIAEMIADDPDLTQEVRDKTFASGLIVTEAVDPEEKTVYEMYYDHQEALAKIPNHRVLAINRGEKEKKLKVKVSVDTEKIHQLIGKTVLKNERSIFYGLLQETIADAYKRLMAPSIEREMRNSLTERAEAEAVKIFAKNTENLLMAPPVKGKKVIAIDPGYRTGCKVAVLDETGKLKAYTTVYPTEPKKDIAGTEAVLKKLVEKFHTDIIVIGNGTGSRETEEVVAGFIKKNGYPIQYTIVNEAGASVYSASKLATEEYPDLDVTTRGAMSLGRRLQDPLAELVKIDPKSIG
ncbi:MAG: Tex-like N-terminal domain-containing protein, partial [Anaerovoracaceae bacterium]|nr:Tex-like N-terminal domain-containing protein [Anaerovoracaceae bacterium]